MRKFHVALIALSLAGLAACGASERVYKAQVDYLAEDAAAKRAEAAERQKAADAFATAAVSKCAPNDSACVAVVVMGRSLQEQAAATATASQAPLQLPQRPPSGGELVAGILRGAIPAALQAGAQWHATDANVDIVRSNNETQSQFYDSVFGAIGTAFENGGSRVTVGGNLGDTYGNDFTGGNRTTTVAGRDQNGRDGIANEGIINDGDGNRFGSPGPFDNVGNGGDGGDCGSGEGGAGSDCSGGGGG